MTFQYKIEIDAFQGPMDLLLHLIDKAEIDIYDIPINLITEQFIEYLSYMEDLNLDIASEFLIMASTLLEIKSKMLLPVKEIEDDDLEGGEDLDPRAELVRRLVEYKKYKLAAEDLRDIEKIQSKVYYKAQEDLSVFENSDFNMDGLEIDVLVMTLNNIFSRRKIKDMTLSISEIQRDEFTLEVCTQSILDQLKEKKKVRFSSFINEYSSKYEIIAYFLSILELISMKHIRVFQEEDFTDLLIMRIEE